MEERFHEVLDRFEKLEENNESNFLDLDLATVSPFSGCTDKKTEDTETGDSRETLPEDEKGFQLSEYF